MRDLIIVLVALGFVGCKKNDPNHELLQKQALMLNEGMEELLADKVSLLTARGAEHPKVIGKYATDANFYYHNTYKLINASAHATDSLIFWNLVKSDQARKYGFVSQLDSSIIYGTDSIMRVSALLLNLYRYLNEMSRSISISAFDYGVYAEWNKTAVSPTINLYGDPSSSFIGGIVMGANVANYRTDTMPLLGTLTLTDTIDITLRPLGK